MFSLRVTQSDTRYSTLRCTWTVLVAVVSRDIEILPFWLSYVAMNALLWLALLVASTDLLNNFDSSVCSIMNSID